MSTTVTVTEPAKEAKREGLLPYDINLPYIRLSEETVTATKYPDYLPSWDKIWFDPLPPFHFDDPALRVKDKSKPNLLPPQAKVTHIQPGLGTIVEGVQLSQLSDIGKDELALLISERKVVAFPNQDLIDLGPSVQQDFMKYFGKPNYQPVSGSVRGYPGFHIIHRNGNKNEINRFLEKKSTTTLWHQDVSYEIQPPGYVMLGLLEGPEVGGDTVFADTAAAYKRLSPTFQSLVDGINATHSSRNMITHTRLAGGLVRKDPVDNVHPLVRVHPVTNEKCLFINGEFITELHGLKEGETRVLLDFLLQHIITGHDFQARVKWQPKTIVMFDNRSTLHSAIVDYIDEEKGATPRHIFRLCAMAERPVSVHDAAKVKNS
ncbi:hypothetical protein D9613_012531 [Agrocybe pediades]|uniref:TauD/TfdA-like domain-containing protein n=1 Tax=Agrocybe pediades TaxID=84607 RepID=A0A8H4QR34_9AGAR|nr:hypothetical protein D9613_012531 [Agrocybe pediades]